MRIPRMHAISSGYNPTSFNSFKNYRVYIKIMYVCMRMCVCACVCVFIAWITWASSSDVMLKEAYLIIGIMWYPVSLLQKDKRE